MKEEMKILVVDDDRQMSKTICDILTIKGHEALPAYTGQEAVTIIQSRGADCVLMDIKMPEINGVETLKMIKNISPDLPIILMSGYATEDQITEAQKLGAYTVLDKPINIEMILSFLSMLRREQSVLVVDDDPHYCTMLKNILGKNGYQVKTEVNPEKVLEHMEKDYRLVVLLDLKLEGADGLDVLKGIRAKYPTKPVLLVTAYDGERVDAIAKGHQIGAYTAFYNPIETEKLVNAIKEIRHKKLSAVLGEPFEMPQQTPKGE